MKHGVNFVEYPKLGERGRTLTQRLRIIWKPEMVIGL
jgi:hypothetical protein